MLGRLLRWVGSRREPRAVAARDAAAGSGQRQDAPPDAGAAEALRRLRDDLKAGAFPDPLQALNDFVERHPDSADGRILLGAAWRRAGRLEEALDELLIAVHHDPERADGHVQLALVHDDLGEREEALAGFERAVACDPGHVEGQRRLGLALLARGEPARAAEALERAIEAAPGVAVLHSDLGFVLGRELGRIDAALAHLDRAVALAPDLLDAQVNRGLVLQLAGEFDAALEHYDHVLARDPGVDQARLNRGLIRLMRGDFGGGWDDYEARNAGSGAPGPRTIPEWDGSDPAGRHLLVCGEQGLGDEIMFASCLQELLARGARLTLACDPRLVALFARSFPGVDVCTPGQAEAADRQGSLRPDFRVGIGSLPSRFRRSPDAFVAHRGYLRADPGRVAYWRERLDASAAGPKIGISWRGGTARTHAAARSIDVARLAPIFTASGATPVSLQYGECSADLERLAASGVAPLHFAEAIADYDETAALVCALDAVVSVCTSVIHLAGALGQRVIVMVPCLPEWRYRSEGTTMPWYPSVELIRQRSRGDWDPVVAEATARVAALPAQRC